MKRFSPHLASLSSPVPTAEGMVELGATISQEEHNAKWGRSSRSDQERVQLAMDVTDTLAKLPPELCALAEQLQHGSLSEAARTLGVPRTSLEVRSGAYVSGSKKPI